MPDHEAQHTVNDHSLERAVAQGQPPRALARAARSPAPVVTGIALLALFAAFVYFWSRNDVPMTPEMPAPVASRAAPAVTEQAAIRHPIDLTPGAAPSDALAPAPLPALSDSDTVAMDSLATILNGDTALRLLIPDSVIRQIVATVDNLPRQTMSTRVLPLLRVPGSFETMPGGGTIAVASRNATRYAPYVAGAEAIDASRLAGLYVRLYPLFQEAYVQLGYPNGYFNDRLIVVIDHLLAAPEPQGAVNLTQPKVFFAYADADLESRSAGQKIMMRMGLENERRLKAKLHEIRKALVAEAPKP